MYVGYPRRAVPRGKEDRGRGLTGTTSLLGYVGLSCLGTTYGGGGEGGRPPEALFPGKGQVTLCARGLQLLPHSANKVWAVQTGPCPAAAAS